MSCFLQSVHALEWYVLCWKIELSVEQYINKNPLRKQIKKYFRILETNFQPISAMLKKYLSIQKWIIPCFSKDKGYRSKNSFFSAKEKVKNFIQVAWTYIDKVLSPSSPSEHQQLETTFTLGVKFTKKL